MNTPLNQSQIEEFTALYEKGCKLQKGLVILDGTPPKRLNFLQKRNVKKSIQLLKEALAIYPDSWQSLFFIGKANQALGNLEEALTLFIKVQDYEPENQTSKKLLDLARAVAEGRVTPPKSEEEILKHI